MFGEFGLFGCLVYLAIFDVCGKIFISQSLFGLFSLFGLCGYVHHFMFGLFGYWGLIRAIL